MRLLIVDDDLQQIERYGDLIEEFNRRGEIEIRPEYRTNFDEGFKALSQDYDGAVIDLKLSGEDEAQGNLIIKEIRNNRRFPVCVMTGYPQDLDPELQAESGREPNLFFWVERRDRPFPEVLDRLSTIFRSGVVEIVGPHGVIEEALHAIFWTHLAKTLSFWNTQEESSANRKNRLVRFILSLLLSKLEANEEGTLDDSYPDEMYVIPSFREHWQTGDIVKNNEHEDYSVILTPACDLAQNKAESIQIVQVEGFQAGLWANKVVAYKKLEKRLAEENAEETKEKQAKVFNDLFRLASNSSGLRYHFLPQCQTFPGGILNFQKVSSIQVKEFAKSHTKLGTITPSFLKDIVARFSNYYARQGQPDFESERLVKDLLR